MESLSKKISNLKNEITNKIFSLLQEKGVESSFSNELVLKVFNESVQFNLEGGRYLVELNSKHLIDSSGYRYELYVLDLEEMCLVLDSIEKGLTPNFKVVLDDRIEYFENLSEAYDKFVKLQCAIKDGFLKLEEREKEFDRHGMPKYKIINEHLVE